MEQYLQEYRNHLIAAEQKAQEDFDKTVLSLSGGALGISFAFIKDIVGAGQSHNTFLLLLSWVAWGFSISSVLMSYFFSHLALRRAIEQVDKDKIHNGRPGGCYDFITATLNCVGGLLFLAGVIFIIIFVGYNLPQGGKMK